MNTRGARSVEERMSPPSPEYRYSVVQIAFPLVYRYLVVVLAEHEAALLATIASRGGEVREREHLPPSRRSYYSRGEHGPERAWAPTPERVRILAAFAEHTVGLRGALREHTRGATFCECYVRLAPGSPVPPATKTLPGPVTPKRKRPRLTIVAPQKLQATRLYFDSPDAARRALGGLSLLPGSQVHATHCGAGFDGRVMGG